MLKISRELLCFQRFEPIYGIDLLNFWPFDIWFWRFFGNVMKVLFTSNIITWSAFVPSFKCAKEIKSSFVLILDFQFGLNDTKLDRNDSFVLILFQNLEYIVHSLAREYGSECLETWNTVFADLYPQLASNWTHGGRNSSNGITPYTMGYGADFFWTAIFTVMLVVAICGNLVVFWIVIGNVFSLCSVKRR